MADEDDTLPVEGGGDELLLDNPIADDELPQAQDTPDPVAELAAEMGWAPKDQFKGDPEKWRDAPEFIRAGKDINRSLARDLKDVRSTVENMARTSTSLFEQQMKAEREKLEAQFNAAVDEGDHNEAFKLSREIDRVAAPKPSGPLPEAEAFAERNKWFASDPLARQLAIETSDRLAKQGYSTADQLEQAERAVRKQFPEHFPAPPKPQARVGEGARTASTSRKQGFADLPVAAQKVARDMNDRLGISLDTYAANYFANERKVG
ncbi:MAG: hypothetical protein V4696_10200 [Pseudomonadota bacterium]